ncbi:hypothetical protein B0H13DRAFT_1914809 [Mycena leptocephala]|nr:hypothetical protein B0H13DRAFT_1914809 [Mycena leptocephala]
MNNGASDRTAIKERIVRDLQGTVQEFRRGRCSRAQADSGLQTILQQGCTSLSWDYNVSLLNPYIAQLDAHEQDNRKCKAEAEHSPNLERRPTLLMRLTDAPADRLEDNMERRPTSSCVSRRSGGQGGTNLPPIGGGPDRQLTSQDHSMSLTERMDPGAFTTGASLAFQRTSTTRSRQLGGANPAPATRDSRSPRRPTTTPWTQRQQ